MPGCRGRTHLDLEQELDTVKRGRGRPGAGSGGAAGQEHPASKREEGITLNQMGGRLCFRHSLAKQADSKRLILRPTWSHPQSAGGTSCLSPWCCTWRGADNQRNAGPELALPYYAQTTAPPAPPPDQSPQGRGRATSQDGSTMTLAGTLYAGSTGRCGVHRARPVDRTGAQLSYVYSDNLSRAPRAK